MPDLDLLILSALVDPVIAPELLRDQALPNLARVLAHADRIETFTLPPRASLTTWQAYVFSTRSGAALENVNLAELWAMACGIAPAARGGRYLVEPAHFKIARDHLRLDDPYALDFTIAEARALADAIEPVLVEAGWKLAPIEPATLRHWLVSRDDQASLSGAAIERAIGENVANWQPRRTDGATTKSDDVALAWRRCVNEIQMLWFGHPVNEQRETEGKPSINTLWLSGNGMPRSELPHYVAVDSGLSLLAALSIEPDATRSLESFDRFIDPARAEDWSGWREQLERLDARIAGVFRQQADGAIGSVALVLCGAEQVKVVSFRSSDLKKFWRGWGNGPSLVTFLSEGNANDGANAPQASA
jgi:hypothetical protein